jgi:hypothetical protein
MGMPPYLIDAFQFIETNWDKLPPDRWLAVNGKDVVAQADTAGNLKKMIEKGPEVVIVLRHDGKPFKSGQ